MSSNDFPYTNIYGESSEESTVQLRRKAVLQPAGSMIPIATASPWNTNDPMPWSLGAMSSSSVGVVRFNAAPPVTSISTQTNKAGFFKRKSSIESKIPIKQMCTEERMADRLSKLHITSAAVASTSAATVAACSSGATSHNSTATDTSDDDGWMSAPLDIMDDDDEEFCMSLTKQEMEDKLKNAQRITVCDEVRNFETSDQLLPKALLNRIEKQNCTALVLWQPPLRLEELASHLPHTARRRTRTYATSSDDMDDMQIQDGIEADDDDDDEDVDVDTPVESVLQQQQQQRQQQLLQQRLQLQQQHQKLADFDDDDDDTVDDDDEEVEGINCVQQQPSQRQAIGDVIAARREVRMLNDVIDNNNTSGFDYNSMDLDMM